MLPQVPVQNTQIHTIWGRFRQVQTDVHNGGYGPLPAVDQGYGA
jgi:hypothetical protein